MKLFKSLSLIAAVALAGCASDESSTSTASAADDKPAEAAKAAAEPEPAATPSKPEAAADGDYVKVAIAHAPAKADDPVVVKIPKFSIKSASFDPGNLEGATAELELDLTSIDSGVPKRDGHLKSPDYLDAGKFATATVKIGKVKKAGDDYAAEATVSAHGVDKSFPVTFQVTDKGEDWVKVKATHKFRRADFGIGKAEGDPAAQDLEIEMGLTFKKA